MSVRMVGPNSWETESAPLEQVECRDRLVTFLYILLRDELPMGKVELVMRDQVETITPDNPPIFSLAHLEAYARELAERLRYVKGFER